MAYRAALMNFTKGEVSPEVEARFDISIYNAALRRARNVRVLRTGGVTKRMGTRWVANAVKGGTERLLPFQFSNEQAYALELGQGVMRPLALGGAVLETGLKITAITKAAHAQITAANHGYKVGDQVYVYGVKGMTEINDRFLTVLTVVNANSFTVNFDSANASTFTGDTGGSVNSSPPPAPPVVTQPPPIVTPPPPPVSSGGGGGYTGGGGGGGGGSGAGSGEWIGGHTGTSSEF
jgi:hypothetical protein